MSGPEHAIKRIPTKVSGTRVSISAARRGLSPSDDGGMRGSSLFVLFPFCLPYGYALCIILKVGQYAQNAGAVFSLKYHLVWCPNYRRPVLVGAVDRRLQALLQQKTKELNIHIHALEILPDHVHLFVESDPTRCVAEIVNRRKGFTSHTLRAEFGFAALAIAHSLESQLLCRYGRLRQRNGRP